MPNLHDLLFYCLQLLLVILSPLMLLTMVWIAFGLGFVWQFVSQKEFRDYYCDLWFLNTLRCAIFHQKNDIFNTRVHTYGLLGNHYSPVYSTTLIFERGKLRPIWKIRIDYQWIICIYNYRRDGSWDRSTDVEIKRWSWFWYKTVYRTSVDRQLIDTPEEASSWAKSNGFTSYTYKYRKPIEKGIIDAFCILQENYQKYKRHNLPLYKERLNKYQSQVLDTYWREQKDVLIAVSKICLSPLLIGHIL